MRIFVTGASGHVAAALIPELLAHGHQVTGLARSDTSTAVVRAAGATPLRGGLSDLATLQRGATEADGVIHLAFDHDAMRAGDFAGALSHDLTALRAMGEVLAGTNKPFVGTSGTMMLTMGSSEGQVGTEEDAVEGGPRVEAENLVISWAEQGIRSSVVRLPPITHSTLDHHGFAPTLIQMSRAAGYSGYPGDGANRWPSVQTLDAARVYRLAVETAPAGSRLHAVAEEGVPFKELAEAIGRGTRLPVREVPADQLAQRFGFLEHFVSSDNPTSSSRTRALLGWEPREIGLIEDLDQGHYFEEG